MVVLACNRRDNKVFIVGSIIVEIPTFIEDLGFVVSMLEQLKARVGS